MLLSRLIVYIILSPYLFQESGVVTTLFIGILFIDNALIKNQINNVIGAMNELGSACCAALNESHVVIGKIFAKVQPNEKRTKK